MIIKSLEDALKQKDWNIVKDLYKLLSGNDYKEKEENPVKKKGRPKKNKEIIIPTKEEEKVFTKESNESLLDKFRIKPKEGVSESEKKYGKILPHVPPKTNLFKDDRKLEIDNFDKKVRNKNNSIPIERRPPVEIIKANCVDCNRIFDILIADMKINADDGKSFYRCDSCWVSKKTN